MLNLINLLSHKLLPFTFIFHKVEGIAIEKLATFLYGIHSLDFYEVRIVEKI